MVEIIEITAGMTGAQYFAALENNFGITDINTWAGKKLCTYGDSITHINNYQPTVMSKLDITTHYLRGVGGSRVVNVDFDNGGTPEKMTYFAYADGSYTDRPIRYGGTTDTPPVNSTEIDAAMCTQERVDTIPLDTDLLLIMGGSNDTSALGVFADSPADNTTFCAAFQLMLDRIMIRIPNARIVVIGFPYHKTSDYINTYGAYGARRNACGDMANGYGFPYIDLKKLCGWNANNISTKLDGNVHPNAQGGVEEGIVISGILKTFEP